MDYLVLYIGHLVLVITGVAVKIVKTLLYTVIVKLFFNLLSLLWDFSHCGFHIYDV